MSARVDHKGKTFERLTVLGRVYGRTKYVRCQCSCGEQCVVAVTNLVQGRTKSCGCLRREIGRVKGYRIPRRKPTLMGFIGLVRASYINNNKRRNMPVAFALTVEECLTLFMGDCRYCGAAPFNKFSTVTGTYDDFRYSGIDRLNANLGYVTGNCVSCCATCNYAKQSMSEDIFLTWIAQVYVHAVQHTNIQAASVQAGAPCVRARRDARKETL